MSAILNGYNSINDIYYYKKYDPRLTNKQYINYQHQLYSKPATIHKKTYDNMNYICTSKNKINWFLNNYKN